MALRNDYVQETLLPPEALELTLRIGVVGSANHVQYQLELRNPSDGTLLALEARPSAPMSSMGSDAYEWLQKALDALYRHVVPF